MQMSVKLICITWWCREKFVPLSMAHKQIVLIRHGRKTSLLSFFLKLNITLQKLLFQSKWLHNFNKKQFLINFFGKYYGLLWSKIFFFWKVYILPFQKRYTCSFPCCCKTCWDMIFCLNKVSFANFGPWGIKWVNALWVCVFILVGH